LCLAAAGAALGSVVAFAIGRVLASATVTATAADPAVLSLSIALLGAVTLLACYLPARRACRIDPASVLRSD
jgi:ABC-type antimicrobial peptide transport system permease subunit